MKRLLYLSLIYLLWGYPVQAAVLRLVSPQAIGGTLSTSVGDTVTVQVSIDTEGQQIRGLEVFISLPDSIFQVVDASSAQGIQPFQTSGFIAGSVIINRLFSEEGQPPQETKLDYSEIRQVGSNSGTGIVASFRLAVRKATQNFSITIDRQFPLRNTKFFIPGQDNSAAFRQLSTLQGRVVGFPIAAIPAQRVPLNSEDRTLDLDDYTTHPTVPDANLTWTATGFDVGLIFVSIDGTSHIVTIQSTGTRVGQTTVVFTATTPTGETGSATAAITVTSGPKLALPSELSLVRDTFLRLDLDRYVEDADNQKSELIWQISGGNRVTTSLIGQTLTITPASGWTGIEILTVKVSDPENNQDQKSVVITVAADTTSSGNGGTNGPPPDKTVLTGQVGIWNSASGDTLLYVDIGDTLNLDIHTNVGSERANGFELFVAIDSRYLSPIDQQTDTGMQPFKSRGALPESSVFINSVLTLPDTMHTHLRYAEVSLSGTTTAATTVSDIKLRVIRILPAGVAAFITIENDTINQRKTSFTIQGNGQNIPLIPRNRVKIQNRPPNLIVPSTLSVLEDEELVLNLDTLVEDREFTPQQMTWTISSLEPGFIISQNQVEQRATLRPPSNWNGKTTLIFQIADPNGVHNTKTSTITVISVNDPPKLSDTFKKGVTFNEDHVFVVAIDSLASDPDNTPQSLTWAVTGQETFAAIDPISRLMQIVPAPNWYGQDTIDVKITDPENASDNHRVAITVRPVNDPPTFLSSFPTQVNVARDTILNLRSYVIDIDNLPETLSWKVSGAKEIGSRIEITGQLILSIPTKWTGTERLAITVTDPHNSSSETSLQISRNALLPGDFTGDGQVDFRDFLLFAQHFGTQVGNPAFDTQFDLTGDGQVGFADFLLFALNFG